MRHRGPETSERGWIGVKAFSIVHERAWHQPRRTWGGRFIGKPVPDRNTHIARDNTSTRKAPTRIAPGGGAARPGSPLQSPRRRSWFLCPVGPAGTGTTPRPRPAEVPPDSARKEGTRRAWGYGNTSASGQPLLTTPVSSPADSASVKDARSRLIDRIQRYRPETDEETHRETPRSTGGKIMNRASRPREGQDARAGTRCPHQYWTGRTVSNNSAGSKEEENFEPILSSDVGLPTSVTRHERSLAPPWERRSPASAADPTRVIENRGTG